MVNAWISDNDDGTYTNPVLYADYSDPDAIRVGADYYMTASSFSNTPGLPVLHSCDLVNWELIGYALKKLPDSRYDRAVHGCGVWAPAIRYHDGKYFICFPMPDEGIYMCTAKDPYGEWSDPVRIYEGAGRIDPCPFWDEDGRAYLVSGVAKSRIGYKSVLHVQEMRPDGMALIGDPVVVFDGNENDQTTIEGPKLYKRNGWYYIFAPAGGVKTGWQTVLRSRNIFGPYEYRVVMRQGESDINGPHQGAWVDTASGEDWFIHFQDVYAAGRIVHLQPMEWRDDWPVIGVAKTGNDYGEPVRRYRMPNVGRDDKASELSGGVSGAEAVRAEAFKDTDKSGAVQTGAISDKVRADVSQTEAINEGERPEAVNRGSAGCYNGHTGTPDLRWQWNANGKKEWYDTDGQGFILHAVKKDGAYGDIPNLLLQKWQAPEFTDIMELDISNLQNGDEAGVISMGMEYGLISFLREADGVKVVRVLGKQHFGKILAEKISEYSAELQNLPAEVERVFVKYVVERTGIRDLSPTEKNFPEETVSMYYSSDGAEYKKAFEMKAVPGRWVGVKYGVFCVAAGENSTGSMKVRCI